MRALPATAGLLTALSLPATAGGLLIVDDTPGPDVDYADLPAAVSAAFEDDVLLVREGTYSGFLIAGKSLHVVAEPEAQVTLLSAVTVRNLDLNQRVSLRGLDVVLTDEEALVVASCDGPVWVEDCELFGADGAGLFSNPGGPDGNPAARVSASTVAFQRCALTAGDGDFYIELTQLQGAGGDALRSENGSRVSAYGSSFTGGRGGDVADDNAAWIGGRGGHGVWAQSGTLLLSNCALVGGGGGTGGSDFDIILGDTCGSGGPGGGGIFQPAFPIGLADVFLQAVDITSGIGGDGFDGCPGGISGVDLELPNSTVVAITTPPLQFVTSGPINSGGTLNIDLTGEPDATVRFGANATQDFTVFPALPAVLDLGLGGTSIFDIGNLDGTGVQNFQLPLFFGLLPDTALPIYTQGAAASAAGATLGGGSLLLLVGPQS